MKNKIEFSKGPITIGFVFIVIGIIWVLRNFGHIDFSLRAWWPLILIGIGLLNMTNQRSFFSFPGWFLIILGGLFLLTTNEILEWNYVWKFWPVVLIVIGLSVISGPGRNLTGGNKKGSKKNYISGFALFSGLERKSSSKSFRGGNITALFGGVEIDLRNASISPDGAVLELIALFGGVELKIPEDWNIEINSSAIFGGVGNKCNNESSGNDKPMIIRATAIFGGVEIKN